MRIEKHLTLLDKIALGEQEALRRAKEDGAARVLDITESQNITITPITENDDVLAYPWSIAWPDGTLEPLSRGESYENI